MTRFDVLSSDINDFFFSRDRNSIRLSASAAANICERAADNGLRILGIEGGTWLNPGIEARLDSLWSGRQGNLDEQGVRENNQLAAEFIRLEAARHDDRPAPDVFILTTSSLSENDSYPEKPGQ